MFASPPSKIAAPAELIGSLRTFGPAGPVYRVEHRVGEDDVHIVVLESGEELDYPIAQLLDDPEAE